MFKVIKKEDINKLNFEEKEFFVSNISQVRYLIDNRDSLVIIYEEEKVKGFFLVFKNNDSFHIAFYVVSPKLSNKEITKLIENFLTYLEELAKKEGIKIIWGGVDYYNDELFEKFIEKGFSVVSYKMKKEIK
ncbi:MAG: GNAT family N-acetyltransferase [Nanoarchaeota archaeon]